eukprot:TRINITY_DN3872_c0_g1_i2.p1 TRINITY_DN3872_c0_g1~~TRINITY_DN3872_c0_g1_i2.p1  ORF type:complete len:277 (-),score=21.23 TRINITY_DN3872_c0_g1_i2:115-900(-)
MCIRDRYAFLLMPLNMIDIIMNLYDTVKISRNQRHEHQIFSLQHPYFTKKYFRQLIQSKRKARMKKPVLSCGCTEDVGWEKTVRRFSNMTFGNISQLLKVQRIRRKNESSNNYDLPSLVYTGKQLDFKDEELNTCNDHLLQKRKNMQDKRLNKFSLQIAELRRKLRKKQEIARILEKDLIVVTEGKPLLHERTVSRKANSRTRNNLPCMYINSLSRVRSNTYSELESFALKEPLQRRKVHIHIPSPENAFNFQEKISRSFI